MNNKKDKKIYNKSAQSSISFFWTIRQLETIEGLSDQYEEKSITRESNFTSHTYTPLIFLKTIMLELLLKQLYFLKTEEWKKGHNAIKIFDKLDTADKNFIEDEYSNFKDPIELNNSEFIILDFRDFLECNQKFIRDLKYGDGLYFQRLTLYPSHKFYEAIINYIIPKHKNKMKT